MPRPIYLLDLTMAMWNQVARVCLIVVVLGHITRPTAQRGATPPFFTHLLRPNYTIDPRATPLIPDCKISGNPQPVITWTRNGNSLPSQESSSGPYYLQSGVLVLRKATPSHSGNYTCSGTNSLGTVAASTLITVVEPKTAPVWERWWMFFVYSAVAWVLGTSCLLVIFCCLHHTRRRKPNPVNRDECFAIDHGETSRNTRLVADQQMAKRGYVNPSYVVGGNSNERTTEMVENPNGTATTTTTLTHTRTAWEESSTSDSPSSSGNFRTQPGRGSSRRKSANSAFIDTKLQLVEVVDTDLERQPPVARPVSAPERVLVEMEDPHANTDS